MSEKDTGQESEETDQDSPSPPPDPAQRTRRAVLQFGTPLFTGVGAPTRRRRLLKLPQHNLPDSEIQLVRAARLGSDGKPLQERSSSAPPHGEQLASDAQIASLSADRITTELDSTESIELPSPLGAATHLPVPSASSTPKGSLSWEDFDQTVVEAGSQDSAKGHEDAFVNSPSLDLRLEDTTKSHILEYSDTDLKGDSSGELRSTPTNFGSSRTVISDDLEIDSDTEGDQNKGAGATDPSDNNYTESLATEVALSPLEEEERGEKSKHSNQEGSSTPLQATIPSNSLAGLTTTHNQHSLGGQTKVATSRHLKQQPLKGKMADPTALLVAADEASTRCNQLNDDLDDMDGLSKEYLQSKLDEIDQHVCALNSAKSHFRFNPDARYDDDFKAECVNALTSLTDLYKRVKNQLKSLSNSNTVQIATANPTPTAANTAPQNLTNAPTLNAVSIAVKTKRIQEEAQDTINEMNGIAQEYIDLQGTVITDDTSVRKLNNSIKKHLHKYKSLSEQGLRLVNDAIEISDETAATNLDKALRSMERAKDGADGTLAKAMTSKGYNTSVDEIAKAKREVLTKPYFNGEITGDDFYTFQKKFEEYTSSMNIFTEDDLITLLKNTCLGPDVKSAVQAQKSLKDCWSQLCTLHGNAPLILDNMVRHLSTLNRSPGPYQKDAKNRMQWYVDVKNLMVKARDFATERNITTDLFINTGLHSRVRLAMNFDDSNKINEVFRNHTNYDGVADVEACYGDVINFLTERIERTALDISGHGATEAPVETKPSPTKAKSNKKVYATQQSSGSKQRDGGAGNSSARSGTPSKPDEKPTPPLQQTGNGTSPRLTDCELCKRQHTHYYFCRKFLEMSIKERQEEIKRAKVCRRCLRLDTQPDFNDLDEWWKTHANNCRTKFVCDKNRCQFGKHRLQRHILVCAHHSATNASRLTDFIKDCAGKLPTTHGLLHVRPDDATPVFHAKTLPADADIIPDPDGPGIFMMQRIVAPNGKIIHVFFDSGCGTAAMTKQAAEAFNSINVRPGPTLMQLAGGQIYNNEYGDDCIYVDVKDNKRATVIGVVMPKLTAPFPEFELTSVFQEFEAISSGKDLPSVPDVIGGSDMDVIIGIKYSYLFPQLVLSLPGGLSLYSSPLKGADGHQGVLGGPHTAWQQAENATNHLGATAYFTQQFKAYYDQSNALYLSGRDWHCEELEADILASGKMADSSTVMASMMHARHEEKRFMDVEDIGTEAMYRCPSHRNCSDCKRGDTLEKTSFREELEQSMIQQSVTYDHKSKALFATLPFTQDPVQNLEANYHVAKKILEGQVKKVSNKPEIREQVITSHNKLVSKGYSVRLDELDPEERKVMDDLPGDYHLPWRFVHKETSLSTPVRCVFDASSRTASGKSLNDCLAKGQNKLEKILSLLLNFRAGSEAFTCDITMAYNQLQLGVGCRRWHKYLWQDELDPKNPVHTRVMKTIIYGVVSSGNQTAEGLEKLARYCSEYFPQHRLGASVLETKTYVDDASDAADDKQELFEKISGVDFTLSLGSMSVKTYVVSGEKPHESVAREGRHVSILGYQWTPETDELSLEPKELYLGKSHRGKKPEKIRGDIRSALMKSFTRRVILGKVACNFDPLGLFTPLTAVFKLDYAELSGKSIGWDDGLPLQYLDRWTKNLETMQEMQQVSFPRSVVLGTKDVMLLISVDASQSLAVACVHVRSELDDGSIVIRLAAAKSKIIHGSTIPRAELRAAVIGSVLGDAVRKNLKGKVSKAYYITDSTVVLNWIHQDSRPMTIAVRNNVIEIRRFTDRHQWRHVDTNNNIADLGTRGKATVASISSDSDWQCGRAWMHLPESEFPLKTVEEIQPTSDDNSEIRREIKPGEFCGHILEEDSKLQQRYEYSQYLVDPCVRPYPAAVSTLVYVRRFCYWFHPDRSKRQSELPGVTSLSQSITPGERKLAADYFFRKGTAEVKHFVAAKNYKNVTTEKDGILLYNARIFDGTEIKDMANVMVDVGPLQFCVPILDRHSPVAYSIMLYAHQELAHHRNVNTTLVESRQIAFVLSGRDLAKEIRAECVSCRRYKARVMEVEMAKIHPNRLVIAPPFYFTQADLMGPFEATCEHNHRSTVKVWGAVFRDPACGAVSVHAMAKYDTDSFVAAFQRFSIARGYPAKLYIDQGSQLIKACSEMEISPANLTATINGKLEVGIEHEIAPTAGHNYQGCVERTIQEVKKIYKQVFFGLKFDVLNYETAFAHVANEINNLPIGLGSRTDDLGQLDLLTPSRLLFGRNNRRAPVGGCEIAHPGRLLKQMDNLYSSWWQVWLNEKLSDYVPQPATFRNTGRQPQVGDICVFVVDRGEAIHNEIWKVGRIISLKEGTDGLIREVTIEYRNAPDEPFKTTRRITRRVAILFSEDELSITESLNIASKAAARHHLLQKSSSP